jgi:hypothetical protein
MVKLKIQLITVRLLVMLKKHARASFILDLNVNSIQEFVMAQLHKLHIKYMRRLHAAIGLHQFLSMRTVLVLMKTL